MCQVMQAADLTAGPVPGAADDSAVVFVSCVLKYVSDPEAALRELQRMAGARENLFIVFVEAWTVTKPDGSIMDVAPGRAAPIMQGNKINFGPAIGEIRS